MHRVSDGIIWAGTAAVAFGVVVSSLLYGSEPPWLVVAIVVLAGIVARSHAARWRRLRTVVITTPASTTIATTSQGGSLP